VISVAVFQPLPGQEIGFLAVATVSRGRLHVDGPRQDLIDTSRDMYSSRTRGFVNFDDDREEWLRAFAESFRSAQVVAAITKDSEHKELIASADVLERLEQAQAAAH